MCTDEACPAILLDTEYLKWIFLVPYWNLVCTSVLCIFTVGTLVAMYPSIQHTISVILVTEKKMKINRQDNLKYTVSIDR